MEYEDTIIIATPEGLDVELSLAGVGSRFMSALIDFLIEGAVIIALGVALYNTLPDAAAAAVLSLGAFAVIFGYHVLFETLASGRTPGKRVAGLRVVRLSGAPVRFKESAIRNIVRLIDLLPPVTYGLGAVVILITRRNQRLGDLAAGTIVVRVRPAPRRRPEAVGATPAELEQWDVSALGAQELLAVRRFLERRSELDGPARADLARSLATRLRPQVAGAPDGPDERFLEHLVAAKAARG